MGEELLFLKVDYRGARGSNAGDDFHELWAVRQALTLLSPDSDLKAVTLEGVAERDSRGATPESWDGVDCALYFGGYDAPEATSIELLQLNIPPPMLKDNGRSRVSCEKSKAVVDPQ
jgi:hypothetical protein